VSQLEQRINIAKRLQASAARVDASSSSGAVSFIDLRDEADREILPLSFAVALHHHDVLSGACKPLLPADKNAELFVISTHRQRAVNGFNALRRWGYENVVVADSASLARFSTTEEVSQEAEGGEEVLATKHQASL
jgi:rhodanese-related sulfurtransferase